MQGETAGRDTRAPERNAPARSTAEDRTDAPASDDATHGGNRSRGHDTERDAEDDSERRGPMASDEFPLISVPLDTWVGRYVRITTPRHKGTTGLVHRTGNGWVNLQTSLGDVAKRAYDLVVIPQSKANISGVLSALVKGGELPRGKRYSRGSKGGSGMGSNSGSADERKGGSRSRTSRTNASAAGQTSSDSSGQDDDDEHGNGRSTRRRGRAPMDDGSDYDDADPGDDDDEGGNDDHRYGSGTKMRNASRGGGRGFPGSGKSRTIVKSGGRDKADRDRFGGGEPVKSSGRMSITYTRRDGGGGAGKQRGRGEHDRMRERGSRGEPPKGAGRERDVIKGDALMPLVRGKEKDSDPGGSRAKRRDGASYTGAGESDDKLGAVGAYRERVDRSSNKLGATGLGKKDEEVIKSSWVHQMQRAKERPNLVHWRDELVAITKDSSEDFEDATLSVELMRVRCDVCYHEKSDGDKFCWNENCWMSPVFSGYCHTGANDETIAPPPAPQSAGYINTFGRETLIDPALTSALQAPVKWLETKRKRKLESHEVFSEDPALYRWQCWASTHQDPNAKDPTFVEDPRFRDSDAKRGQPGGGAAESTFADADCGTKDNPSVNGDAMDVALSPGTAGGAGRPAECNGNEDRRHGDAGVDMHKGGAQPHGSWS